MKRNSIRLSLDAKELNFREICMGNIAPKTLFRSSHPIKEDDEQEKALALLAGYAGIASVINLSNTDSQLNVNVLSVPWYRKLYKDKRVIALGMDFNFTSDSFNMKLKKALRFIINTEGPWLIHCYAGVDRTGIVAIILESLMGASINDISGDYFKSFNSSFESSIFTGRTDIQELMQLLSVMDSAAIISDENLQSIAESYLGKTIGVTAEEIDLLKGKLSGVNFT